MTFLYAFLIAGIWGAVFQAIFEQTHADLTYLMAGALILGSILSVAGIMPVLDAIAGGGNQVEISSLGAMLTTATTLLMTGVPQMSAIASGMLLGFVITLVSTLVISLVFGHIRYSRLKDRSSSAAGERAALAE